jgi:hypothetical protein
MLTLDNYNAISVFIYSMEKKPPRFHSIFCMCCLYAHLTNENQHTSWQINNRWINLTTQNCNQCGQARASFNCISNNCSTRGRGVEGVPKGSWNPRAKASETSEQLMKQWKGIFMLRSLVKYTSMHSFKPNIYCNKVLYYSELDDKFSFSFFFKHQKAAFFLISARLQLCRPSTYLHKHHFNWASKEHSKLKNCFDGEEKKKFQSTSINIWDRCATSQKVFREGFEKPFLAFWS